jgi:tetratricopeptide (TPR) repeat protein
MNGLRVDIPEFRLRLFENQWLAPLEAAWIAQTASPDGHGYDAIAATLLFEARQWRWLGGRCGYFPLDDSEGPAAQGAFENPAVREIVDAIRSAAIEASDQIKPVDFASAVASARDDLSPDRTEFLRILFFADESEWDSRLHRVSRFADELASDDWGAQSARVLDEVSWSMEGPMSARPPGSMQLPSGWRSDPIAVGRRVHAPVIARLEQLADVRRHIVRAAPPEFRIIRGSDSLASTPSELGVAIWPESFDPVRAGDRVVEYQKLASLREQSADYGEAAHLYETVLELQRKLARSDRMGQATLQDIAQSHLRLGALYTRSDQRAKAEQHYEEAARVTQNLLATRPDDSALTRRLAYSHFRLGTLRQEADKFDEAAGGFMAAITLENGLLSRSPGDSDTARGLAVLHTCMGDVHRNVGKQEEADMHYATALSILRRGQEASGLDTESAQQTVGILMRLGSMRAAAGDEQSAAQHFLSADRLQRELDSGSS